MRRFTMLLVMTAVFATGTALGQPPDCPWRFVPGHWRLTDSTGDSADVVWKISEGNALIGMWEGKDGKATEICGWRADTKELVATGYGPKGEYWEVVFTTVTKQMIQGRMIQRTPDGNILRGIWQVTKTSDDEMPTVFVGTRNGEEVSIKGSFKRVE